MLGRRKGGGPGGGGTRRSIVRQGTAIFAAVLACFIAIQAFFIYTYYRTMRAHVLDTLQVLADQYGGALRYELEALHTSCISLFRDEDVTGLLRLGRGAGRELEEGARRELEAMMGLNGTVRAAYLLDNRHRIVAGVQRSSLPAAEADDLCRRAAAEALGGDGPGEGRYSLVFPAAGGESALFSVVQPIPYRPGFALDEPLEVREQAVVVGYAVLLCELRFTEAERPGGPNRFDYVYAVHSGGRMVYCSDRARWDALSAREDGGGDLYAAVCTLEQGGWTVTAAASRRDIAGLLRHTAASIGAALLAATVVILLTATGWVSKSIVRPVRRLKRDLALVAGGDYARRMEAGPENEIGEICAGVNTILDRLEEANVKAIRAQEEHYHAELLREKAELNYLQAQVNPHFLYNALENVCGMAAVGRTDLVTQTCGALARLFQYAVRPGSAVPLEEEIRYAESYFYVMSQRHRDGLVLEVQADQEARGVRVPKMMLQPLVENAMKHGRLEERPGGIVCIRAGWGEDGVFFVTVSDNGRGIPEARREQLNRLLSGEEDGEADCGGVGLSNVCLRLRQMFGESAGVRMEPADGGGICVVLRMAAGRPPPRRI